MNDILRIVLTWLIPAVLSGLLALIVKIIKDNGAIKKSILAIIRSQITSKCENYLDKGILPEYARYCLTELFNQYKQLGGNHGIEELVEQCYKLPPK